MLWLAAVLMAGAVVAALAALDRWARGDDLWAFLPAGLSLLLALAVTRLFARRWEDE